MTKLTQNIQNHLAKINIELYHLQWDKEFGTKVLQIIIDKDDEVIDMAKIVKISKYISLYLDNSEPSIDNYNLQVLSAGVEREIYNQKHWEKSIGHIVFVVLKKPLNNIKRFFAKVVKINSNKISLEINDDTKKQYEINLEEIKKANWAYKEKE